MRYHPNDCFIVANDPYYCEPNAYCPVQPCRDVRGSGQFQREESCTTPNKAGGFRRRYSNCLAGPCHQKGSVLQFRA